MVEKEVHIRQCLRPGCGLRYPLIFPDDGTTRCPRCRAETRLVHSRPLERERGREEPPASRFHLEAFLDNIRSTGNVGAMFRTADGLGICKLHLAGITATPENPRLAKTALGAELSLPWAYYADGVSAADGLRNQGHHLWALEQGGGSEPLRSIARQDIPSPLILVVGNEVSGVDVGILELCERMVHLPMAGTKRSLNAAVAFGIAAYELMLMNS